MKYTLSLSIISLLLMFFACQTNEMDNIASNNDKVELSPMELLSIQQKNSPELDQNELFGLVEAFQPSKLPNNTNTKSASKVTSFNIKGKYDLNKKDRTEKDQISKSNINTDEQIPIYEIEFISNGDTGMAVVSGDRRAPHILAYIDKTGEIDTSLLAGPNALVQWAEMYIQREVEAFETIKDSIYSSAVSKISEKLKIDPQEINYTNIKNLLAVISPQTRSTPIDEVPSNLQVKSAVFPLCPSTWSQWEPYNCKLDKGDCEKIFPGWIEFSNHPAGIGVVSIAHIMACIEPNITANNTKINWALLTENKEIKAPDYFNPGDPIAKRNMVGDLFKQIYTQTNSKPIKNANNVVTGTLCTVADMENYLKNTFSCGNISSWNINTIITSLETNNNPVYVYGKPDNKPSDGVYPFILDGYKKCFGRIDNVPKDITVKYIHANFGFGSGSQDGYYLLDVNTDKLTIETTIPLIFKDNALTIIPNIKKK